MNGSENRRPRIIIKIGESKINVFTLLFSKKKKSIKSKIM